MEKRVVITGLGSITPIGNNIMKKLGLCVRYDCDNYGSMLQILAKHLGISPHQLSYVTHSGEGEGLLFYGNTILPFIDHFPKETELYKVMTTKPTEVTKEAS